jgi:hypothetical protein
MQVGATFVRGSTGPGGTRSQRTDAGKDGSGFSMGLTDLCPLYINSTGVGAFGAASDRRAG